MPNTKQLYRFLSACGGSWRNTIYISCGEPQPGYLLAFDRDGCPVLMGAGQFAHLTGERPDPAECCGRLTEAAFEALFAQYLLWRVPSPQERALLLLCGDTQGEKWKHRH